MTKWTRILCCIGLVLLAGCSTDENSPVLPEFGRTLRVSDNGPSFMSLQPLQLVLHDPGVIDQLNAGGAVILQAGKVVTTNDDNSPFCRIAASSAGLVGGTRYPVDPVISDLVYLGGERIVFGANHDIAIQCFKLPAGTFTVAEINGTLGSLADFEN